MEGRVYSIRNYDDATAMIMTGTDSVGWIRILVCSVHNCYNNFLLLVKITAVIISDPRPHQHYIAVMLVVVVVVVVGSCLVLHRTPHSPRQHKETFTKDNRTNQRPPHQPTRPGFFVCSHCSAVSTAQHNGNRRTLCSTDLIGGHQYSIGGHQDPG